MGTVFQVSTISALAMGYTKSVISVEELLSHGDIGLGTFEHVNGEMIVVDGICYQAQDDGSAYPIDGGMGVPFAVVGAIRNPVCFDLQDVSSLESLKKKLNLKVEEGFGLNSVHLARIDGTFGCVRARSESPYHSHHVELKEILKDRQEDFTFENISGTLVSIYFPDYLESINTPGWQFHFLSDDKREGGQVFDIGFTSGKCSLQKMNRIDIQLPKDASFDTYSLKSPKHK